MSNQIKIYVVDSEKHTEALESLKIELCGYFGGLTEIPNVKGYWLDSGMRLFKDAVTIWEIWTDRDLVNCRAFCLPLAERVRQITNQISQLIVISGKHYLLNGSEN